MPLSNDMIVTTFLKKEQREKELEQLQERIKTLEGTLRETLMILRKINSEQEAVSQKDIDRLLKG